MPTLEKLMVGFSLWGNPFPWLHLIQHGCITNDKNIGQRGKEKKSYKNNSHYFKSLYLKDGSYQFQFIFKKKKQPFSDLSFLNCCAILKNYYTLLWKNK
jgi:hypothetical protein